MSSEQMHSHGPGQPMHSHGPAQPQQQQQMVAPSVDPVLQAIIDQDFIPTPLKTDAENNIALCEAHSLEKCEKCDLDFVNVNYLSRLLVANPNLRCPPPANVQSGNITQAVTSVKDEGNVRNPAFCVSYIRHLSLV